MPDGNAEICIHARKKRERRRRGRREKGKGYHVFYVDVDRRKKRKEKRRKKNKKERKEKKLNGGRSTHGESRITHAIFGLHGAIKERTESVVR